MPDDDATHNNSTSNSNTQSSSGSSSGSKALSSSRGRSSLANTGSGSSSQEWIAVCSAARRALAELVAPLAGVRWQVRGAYVDSRGIHVLFVCSLGTGKGNAKACNKAKVRFSFELKYSDNLKHRVSSGV